MKSHFSWKGTKLKMYGLMEKRSTRFLVDEIVIICFRPAFPLNYANTKSDFIHGLLVQGRYCRSPHSTDIFHFREENIYSLASPQIARSQLR